MINVLIGMANENQTADLLSLIEELEGYDVRGVARTRDELIDLAGRLEPHVVFVHEHLGIEPVSQTIGDLISRRPNTAVIQVSDTRSSDTIIKALEDGARGVVGYPFAYEDVSSRVAAAAAWQAQMTEILDGSGDTTSGLGTVIAVVGAKGGVGTTTIAAHVAFDHVTARPGEKVCLVDVDVEKGDVGAIFEVRQTVSISDVAKVSGDLSPHAVEDAVIHHETGLHLLLSPLDVRETEYVTAEALRAIVSLLRRSFDLVVLDGGGHVSPTQAAVVEIASECIVVTTPDVLAVRAMRRRMIAWEALGVREEAAFRIVVNKVDRASLFPPGAVKQLTTADVMETTIPFSPRVLEAAMNDRDPRAVTEVAWWKLISKVRREVGLGEAPRETRSRRRKDNVPAEAGAVGIETVGVLPIAILLCLVAWQIAVTGFSSLYAGHASTVAAREYAVSHDVQEAERKARAAVPGPLRSGFDVSADRNEITVTVPVPMGAPVILPTELSSTREVVMEP